jgi:hypothetical protein
MHCQGCQASIGLQPGALSFNAGGQITFVQPTGALQLSGIPLYDSWAWEHRRLLIGGGVVLVGAGLLAVLGAILK